MVVTLMSTRKNTPVTCWNPVDVGDEHTIDYLPYGWLCAADLHESPWSAGMPTYTLRSEPVQHLSLWTTCLGPGDI